MSQYKHNKGNIRDNALAALIRDPLFKQRIERSLKGKGSFTRKAKHVQRNYQEKEQNGFMSLICSFS